MDQLAETISNQLITAQAQSIALYGAWGSGKTSLLNLIECRIDKTKVQWVSADARAHQSEDSLLLSLLSEILKISGENSRIALWRYVAAASAVTAGHALKHHLGLDFQEIIKTFDRSDKDFPKIEESKQIVLSREFSKAVRALHSKQQCNLVVAVDNLDRCRPETALRVLELLFPLMGIEHCTIMVAVDHRVLVSFLDRDYHGTSFDGTRYLEKVFPVAYRIPDLWVCWDYNQAYRHTVTDAGKELPDQVYLFLGKLLAGTSWDDRTPLEPKKSDPIFEVLWTLIAAPRVMRNPRRIKRVVRLIRAYEPDDRSDAETFLFLVILADVWPEAFEFLTQASEESWEEWVCEMSGVARAKKLPIYLPLQNDLNLRDFFGTIREFYDSDDSFVEESPACDQEHLMNHFRYLREVGI